MNKCGRKCPQTQNIWVNGKEIKRKSYQEDALTSSIAVKIIPRHFWNTSNRGTNSPF